MKFYNAYIIRAFESKDLEGRFLDSVEMELVADSEKEALEKAKKMVTRTEYKIENIVVVEKHTEDKYSVFIFQAYEDIEAGKFTNFSVVEVTAENSEEAEKIAKTRITKNKYRLWKIIEKYASS
jgi:hypothetical protein